MAQKGVYYRRTCTQSQPSGEGSERPQAAVSTAPLRTAPFPLREVTGRGPECSSVILLLDVHVCLFHLSIHEVITGIHSEDTVCAEHHTCAQDKLRVLLGSYLGHRGKSFKLSIFTSFPFVNPWGLCKLLKRSRKINCPTVASHLTVWDANI